MKSKNYQYCDEINSEFEKYNSEKSNNTSIDSVSENNLITRISTHSTFKDEGKCDYKAFVNCLLQIKFSRSKHNIPFNKINYKLIWEEIIRLQIPKYEWKSYIQSQFQRPKQRTSKSIPQMNM